MIAAVQCHGTKTLRRRPAFLRTRDGGLVDNPVDSYQCYHCGPPTVYDFNPFSPDDEEVPAPAGHDCGPAMSAAPTPPDSPACALALLPRST